MAEPKVELLWWRGCPSTERALADVRAAMRELGLDATRLDVREVIAEEDARRESFVGSPTIRVDGRDVHPPEPEEPFGLACRIFRRADGRVSPLPDPAAVRAALQTAMENRSTS